jgi:hypothetical protein
VTALRKLAQRNSVSRLYYRIRGADEDRAFVGFSQTKTASIQ